MTSLPLIPFAKLPYKEWNNKGTEKKPRLGYVQHENQIFQISQEIEEEPQKEKNAAEARARRLLARRRKFGYDDALSSDESSESEASDSSSEYDLLDHIKDLLPEEATKFGEKPKKGANTLHLEDMKVVKKKTTGLSFFRRFQQRIEDYKARERERRKHHLLSHFEERVRQYDLQQKKLFEEFLERKKKEELLEEHRRQQRIERNSRKRVEKKLLARQFSSDLQRRERHDQQMLFYSEFFSQWRGEEMDQEQAERDRRQEEQQRQAREQAEREERERRSRLIESDAKQRKEDEDLTRAVEAMMLRSGVIHYRSKVIGDDQEMVRNVFDKNKAYKERQQSLKDEQDAAMKLWRDKEEERERQLIAQAQGGEVEREVVLLDPRLSSMELLLDHHRYTAQDLQSLFLELKKIKFKRNQKVYSYFCPFAINLAEISSTNDIKRVKGRQWKEVGIFSFCYEMTQNGHFLMLQSLDLASCYIRNLGLQQLLYTLKINNLFALQSLDLSANFLSHQMSSAFLETARLNLFQNLQTLNLSKNELRDEGISALIIPLISHKLVLNLQELFLGQNSITNHGFQAIMKILIPLQDPCIPLIRRIALENNLIDGKTRREFFPLPGYVSV